MSARLLALAAAAACAAACGGVREGAEIALPLGRCTAMASNGTQTLMAADETLFLHFPKRKSPSTLKLDGMVLDLAIEGGFCVAGMAGSGARIIDISDPAAPRLLGSVSTRGGGMAVAFDGNLAAVMDMDVGVDIIDLSIRRSPRVVSEIPLDGDGYDVALRGTTLFYTQYETGVHAADLSDPAKPRELGSFAEIGLVWEVSPDGDKLWLAGDGSGVHVLDVSNPAAMRGIASLDLPGRALKVVAVGGNAACVATSADELIWVRLRERRGGPAELRIFGKKPIGEKIIAIAREEYHSGVSVATARRTAIYSVK